METTALNKYQMYRMTNLNELSLSSVLSNKFLTSPEKHINLFTFYIKTLLFESHIVKKNSAFANKK